MSEHTQLYLPSHLSERKRGEGTFFAVFAQLKAEQPTRSATGTLLIPYKEGRADGTGETRGGGDVTWERRT